MNNELVIQLDSIFKELFGDQYLIDKDYQIGGMTNTNYYYEINHTKLVVRIPGENSNVLINRYNEKNNSALATLISINPTLFYYNVDSGIKITLFIDNGETLIPSTMASKDNLLLVANLLKKLHTSGLEFVNEFNVFHEYKRYKQLLPVNFRQKYPCLSAVEKNFYLLEARLAEIGTTLVACHNDVVPENFVKHPEQLYLIDWEYSGMNDPVWDIAALFEEAELGKDLQLFFLQTYYGVNNIPSTVREKILIYRICQNFLWTNWTIIKEQNRNLFGNYGVERFHKCLSMMEKYKQIYGLLK